jgi:hypothetical protein
VCCRNQTVDCRDQTLPFSAERGKIVFRLDRAAWLAKDGEASAIVRL